MTATQDGGTGKTLMIVEDEVLVATALKDELEDAGYHVLDLTDRHAEAMDVAKACKPDLALVNIRLAGRDDGIKLSEQLKGMGIPVLLISGQVSRASSAKTVAIASMPMSNVVVLAGVNLPMLIKLASVRGTMPLLDAAREAEAAGRKYIQLISENLAGTQS